MRFSYHRENLRTCPTYLVGLLCAVAFATLPMIAHADDDDAASIASPAVSEASPAVSDDISEAAPPAWQRIDNNAEIDGSDGPVLELPQVAAPTYSEARVTETPADDTSSEDTSAQDPSMGDEAANNTDNVQTSSPVGDADDYEDRETVTSALQLWPAPATVVAMPRVYLGNNYRAMPRPSVIVVRPGGLLPIPATSPMLSGSFRAGSTLGGWWQRAR
jgi:hypothetical protein